ncbi:craniofacial development protein 2-like [Palaemon carinicauda]|uniref:craniofacial development protein 2-like n=1 Tax=Palaemon carinicauda TaxID=392227 RepID=UPI0035B5C036
MSFGGTRTLLWCSLVRNVTTSVTTTLHHTKFLDGVGREGVEMMMTPRTQQALTVWIAVNSRLLLAKFKLKQCNMSIIVCSVLTNESPEEMEDEYYEALESVIDDISERDMKTVSGNFNAIVGRYNLGIQNVMDVEGLGEDTNDNGAHFISFCSANNLVIGGTLSSTQKHPQAYRDFPMWQLQKYNR